MIKFALESKTAVTSMFRAFARRYSEIVKSVRGLDNEPEEVTKEERTLLRAMGRFDDDDTSD